MNSPARAILIATVSATLELVAPASHAQDTLTISCAAPHLPTQQAVAKALGMQNFGQVYSARDRLMLVVQRACIRGARQVVVSNDQAASSPHGSSHAVPQAAGTTNLVARDDRH